VTPSWFLLAVCVIAAIGGLSTFVFPTTPERLESATEHRAL
jgi:hypothetical protein